MATDKSQKPTNLVPRSFGGEKNNFSDDLIASGFESNVPETYNGDNLNYQLDATGKELDYCEKVVDYINGLGVGKTPIVNANNKLDETQVGLKVYSANETYSLGEWVRSGDKIYQSLTQGNLGNDLTNETYWKEVKLGDEGANVDLSNLSTTGQAKFNGKVDLNASNLNAQGRSYVSGLGMLSSKYVDLTLGASGSTYTAPANGYYSLDKQSTSNISQIWISNSVWIDGRSGQQNNSYIQFVTPPCQKGDIITVMYVDIKPTSGLFRFVYAEGSKE